MHHKHGWSLRDAFDFVDIADGFHFWKLIHSIQGSICHLILPSPCPDFTFSKISISLHSYCHPIIVSTTCHSSKSTTKNAVFEFINSCYVTILARHVWGL